LPRLDWLAARERADHVADRLRLDADVSAELTRYDWATDVETYEATRARVVNEVRLEVYLEDRLSLQPYAELWWYELDMQAPVEAYEGAGPGATA